MKIIKQGNLKHPMTFVCPKCGCEFIAEEGEYISRDSSLNPITPYAVKYVEVTCPCCGYKIVEYKEQCDRSQMQMQRGRSVGGPEYRRHKVGVNWYGESVDFVRIDEGAEID